MTVICLMSLVFFQEHAYEIFLRSHMILALAVVVALWSHLSVRQATSRFILLAGFCMWALLSAILFGVNLARNIRLGGRYLAETTVEPKDGLYVLQVIVPRYWSVQDGQYVYLRMFRVGLFLERHPFMICWSEKIAEDDIEYRRGGRMRLYILMKPQRGFTKSLANLTGTSIMTWVDGPYGKAHDEFGDYGTVVMIADGTGVAPQLLSVRTLSKKIQDCEVRTRRIILLWVFDKQGGSPAKEQNPTDS